MTTPAIPAEVLDAAVEDAAVIHIEIGEASKEQIARIFDEVTAVVYGHHAAVDALVSMHTSACEKTDHCCGPGSRYLDGVIAAAKADALEEFARSMRDRPAMHSLFTAFGIAELAEKRAVAHREATS